MTLGEKIYKLRTEKGLSQEAFGESLGVSRQSVSKWETNQSVPELDKIVAISELFGVSTDYLLKENPEKERSAGIENADAETGFHSDRNPSFTNMARPHYEYKSKKTIKGLPLVHVNTGLGLYRARGIIAIGNIAEGVVAIGFISAGVISLGLLAAGLLLSIGTIAVALLVSVGSLAVACISFGAVSIGLFSMGALTIGQFSYGALAYGKQVAIGDEAHGKIALGFSRAVGELYEEVRADHKFDYPTIEKIINEQVPSQWFLFKNWIKGMIWMMTGAG